MAWWFVCRWNSDDPLHYHPVRRNRFKLLAGAAGPEDLDGLRVGGIAQANRYGQFRLREVAAGGHHLTPKRLAAQADNYPRADGTSVAFRANQIQPKPMVMELLVIAEE